MAFDWARLTEITYIANSAGAIYTNPAGKKTYIRLIIIHNNNTTVEQVKLYNVPDSGGSVGSAGDANIFLNMTVQPAETLVLGSDMLPVPGIILENENDTIQGVTTTASKVTVQIFGGQE